jgi:hypothetical protein
MQFRKFHIPFLIHRILRVGVVLWMPLGVTLSFGAFVSRIPQETQFL